MTSRDEKGDKYGRQVWETRNRKNIQVKGTRIRDKKLGAKQRSSRHLGSPTRSDSTVRFYREGFRPGQAETSTQEILHSVNALALHPISVVDC